MSSSANDDEAKLRTVVNRWASQGSITTVLGFSGTPYLDKKDKIAVTEEQSVATTEMSNITNYYPLAEGIGNFLKVPKVVRSDSSEREEIVEKGVPAPVQGHRVCQWHLRQVGHLLRNH